MTNPSDAEQRNVLAVLHSMEKLRLGSLAESRQQTRGHQTPLDAAQECTIARRRVQRSDVQAFRRAIGKGERPGRRVELAREEGGLFHLDLCAKPTQRDDEHVLTVGTLSGEKANAAIESLSQTAIENRLALVSPRAIVVQDQSKRAERRRTSTRQLSPR